MKESLRLSTGVLVAAALLAAGCGASKIVYTPLPGSPPAATASVALKVVDERPADKGGTDKNQIGQVRGSYGIPSAVKDASMDVAPRTVTEATTDALKQAGVGVSANANRTLVATVKHFWFDGLMGYKATVAVTYSLQDASGNELWSKEVSGGAGGTNLFKSGESMAQDMYAKALTDLATKATQEFKSPEFQKAVR